MNSSVVSCFWFIIMQIVVTTYLLPTTIVTTDQWFIKVKIFFAYHNELVFVVNIS